MTSKDGRQPARKRPIDGRDRLILALYAQLKAERETRAALEEAIRNGVVSSEVLTAIASDPVPVVTDQDIAEIETVLGKDKTELTPFLESIREQENT